MPAPVEVPIVFAQLFAIFPGRNNCLYPYALYLCNTVIAVIGPVCQ